MRILIETTDWVAVAFDVYAAEFVRTLLLANAAAASTRHCHVFGSAEHDRPAPEDRLWVYSRGGQPCPACGTRIESRKDGDAARVTYWCPRCQPSPVR